MNTTPSFEVPGAMRELAEKSIDQARQAFDNFVKSARQAASTTQESAEAARKNAQDLTTRTLQAAEQNVHAALDHAQNLAKAKSVQEAVQLQVEFTRAQFATIQSQAKEFGGMAQSVMQQGAEQSRSTMQEAVDQTRKAVAQDAQAMSDTGDNAYELGREGAP